MKAARSTRPRSIERSHSNARRIDPPSLAALVAPLLLCMACGGTAQATSARDVRITRDEASGHPSDRVDAERPAVTLESFRAYALPRSYARLANTRRLDAAHWQVGTYRVKVDDPLVVLPTFVSVPSEIDWRLDAPLVSDDGDVLYGIASPRRDAGSDPAPGSLAIAPTSTSHSPGGSLVLRALPDHARSVHFVSRDVGYATGNGRVYATIDQARSWHPVPMGNLPDGTCAACELVVEIGGSDRAAWQRAPLTLF